MRSEPILEAQDSAISVVTKDPELDPAKSEFWLSRLVHRKYGGLAQPSWPRQYSARVEHQGIGHYFPLGSDDRNHAAKRARDIYMAVAGLGWEEAFRRFPREITLCVFWRRHPIASTYTTLYTEPRITLKPKSSHRTRSGQKHVLIIEPDPGLRTALEQWLDSASASHCIGSFHSARAAFRSAELKQADLCLFNQHLPEFSEQEILRKLRSLSRDSPAFSFGFYEQSDDIFASLSGVREGYFLRRRSPTEMLDPIHAVWQEGAVLRELINHGITRYFQDLFVSQDQERSPHEGPALTSREQEVLNCLRRGHPDKQIADALAIRPSTVHTHLKKIFEKLCVHTRTEAVMKYLQK